MSRWLTEWRHRRILKGLWIDPRELELRWNERKCEADAMPCMINYGFVAASWIVACQKKPKVGRSRLGGVR